jgi:hypothetical protein
MYMFRTVSTRRNERSARKRVGGGVADEAGLSSRTALLQQSPGGGSHRLYQCLNSELSALSCVVSAHLNN